MLAEYGLELGHQVAGCLHQLFVGWERHVVNVRLVIGVDLRLQSCTSWPGLVTFSLCFYVFLPFLVDLAMV